jgi:signal transduction histidine kinase
MAHFRVAARTILHLGAELISSDAIALYELIKNAFDARSKEVHINVVVRVQHTKYKELRAELSSEIDDETSKKRIKEFREKILAVIDTSSLAAKELKDEIQNCNSLGSLVDVLDSANFISIEDTGEGMSLNDLEEIYLTIGTRSRYKQRIRAGNHHRSSEDAVEESIQPILGEKGVGRLSAMRLGQRLKVKTKTRGEKQWNFINIDWSQFSHESDQSVENVDTIELNHGKQQIDPSIHGTIVTISGLTSQWSQKKLEDIAGAEFSKLMDPFTSKAKYPIKLSFNGEKIRIPTFDILLPKMAHAYVETKYTLSHGTPSLEGTIDYFLYKKSKNFSYSADELINICKPFSLTVLKSLGPFKMMFYWFNRRLIKGIDGIGNQQYLRNLVSQWAGGLMVFRDGFRINPYGGENDDWLDLDKKAFGTGGFKLNRRQVIGKVDISSLSNPTFKDQTNREGLQWNEEFEALRTILKFIFHNEFKVYTDYIEEQTNVAERVSFKILDSRLSEQEEKINENLEKLIDDYKIPRKTTVIRDLGKAINQIRDLLNKAKELADFHDEDKSKYLHLAALGLMAEIIAHELNRASSGVLFSLEAIEANKIPPHIERQLEILSSQIKTLRKRLKILDPMSTRGRQVKETFDLVSWVKENISSHKAQFERHGIKCNISTKPASDSKFLVKAVKGMVVQIIENLIDNSVYWLNEYKMLHEKEYRDKEIFKPEINIEIDTKSARICFSDNGLGIPPDRKIEVFLPFFSTKPFKIGKGLGLYISRELAEYNGATLDLLDKRKNNMGNLTTFVLDLGNMSA